MEPTTSQKPIELPFAESHAFIIGINNYENISSLSTAVNDAKGIATRLKEQHGYKVHPPLLNATKAEILQWITEDIPKAIGPEDRVVFYFAGHGIALDGEEGPNGYLVPSDADTASVDSLIPMNDFHKMLDDLPCKHGLLILDCCFAGAFKWSTGYRDMVFDMPSVIYEERFWRYVKDPAWQVITSAAYDQKAADVLSNRTLGMREAGGSGVHSPFAQALFEALEGQGDVIPHGGGDGVITATEIYMYLRDKVENNSDEEAKRQTPSLFTLPKHDKGEFIFLHPKHRFNLPPAPDRNPFMGLSSFNEDDAHLFYGRERVVEALREMIKDKQLMVVSGASGTGKSSVIKAGLLPKLRKEGWQVLPIIRPGKEPKKNLDSELPDAEERFKENGRSVLVIDQYEELITQTLDPEEGKAFEQQLVQWMEAHPDLRIVLSIRSDFEPQFENSELAPWWNDGRYIVPAFTLEEVREVIVKPANQEVLFFEPEELVDKLVEEVSQAPGALPLLSFTLSELYEAYLKSGRSDRALLQADYEQLGGVIGALRTRADEAYNNLDEAYKNSMRKLMLRMVSIEGGEMAGKRVYADEMKFSSGEETTRLEEVAKKLVDARLILRGKDGMGKVYVEPAHDALVRAWARLWEWIKAAGEEKLSLHTKLSLAVNDYYELVDKEPKKAANLLWNNNPRLDLLNAELQEKDHPLNAKEETFVRTSVKRRTARKRRAWTIAVAVMVGLAGLAIWAIAQQIRAGQEQILSEAKSDITVSRTVVNTNSVDAAKLALRGYGATAFDLNYNFQERRKEDVFQIRNELMKLVHGKLIFPVVDSIDNSYMYMDLIKVPKDFEYTTLYPYGNSIVEKGNFNNTVCTYYPKNNVGELQQVYWSQNYKFVIGKYLKYGIPTFVVFRHKGEELTTVNPNSRLLPFLPYPIWFCNNGSGFIELNEDNEFVASYYPQKDDSGSGVKGKPRTMVINGFGVETSAAAISPSGKYFVIGSRKGQLKVLKIPPLSKGMKASQINEIANFETGKKRSFSSISFWNNESIILTKFYDFDENKNDSMFWYLDNPFTFKVDSQNTIMKDGEIAGYRDYYNNEIRFGERKLKNPDQTLALKKDGLYAERKQEDKTISERLIWFNDKKIKRSSLSFSDDYNYIRAGEKIYHIDNVVLADVLYYYIFADGFEEKKSVYEIAKDENPDKWDELASYEYYYAENEDGLRYGTIDGDVGMYFTPWNPIVTNETGNLVDGDFVKIIDATWDSTWYYVSTDYEDEGWVSSASVSLEEYGYEEKYSDYVTATIIRETDLLDNSFDSNEITKVGTIPAGLWVDVEWDTILNDQPYYYIYAYDPQDNEYAGWVNGEDLEIEVFKTYYFLTGNALTEAPILQEDESGQFTEVDRSLRDEFFEIEEVSAPGGDNPVYYYVANDIKAGWISSQHLLVRINDYYDYVEAVETGVFDDQSGQMTNESVLTEEDILLEENIPEDVPPNEFEDINETGSTTTGIVFGIVTQSVSIRSVAGSKDPGTVVGGLAAGTQVEILEEDIPEGQVKPWYKVNVNGVEGWVYSNFVEKQ